MQTARLIEMGQLATVDPDGQRADYPMALLLTFDNANAIRAAIREGKVQFVFGDDPLPCPTCEDGECAVHPRSNAQVQP